MEKGLFFVWRLILLSGILSVVLGGIFILVISKNEFIGIFKEDEQGFFCGTTDLPENKIFAIEHPGRAIYNEHCKVCHSHIKDFVIVGPSLYGTVDRIDQRIFDLLLFDDPKEQLLNTDYYKELKEKFAVDFHSNHKFRFDDSTQIILKSFIDTLTAIR